MVPEALRGCEEQLDEIPEDTWAGGQGPGAGGYPGCGQAMMLGHSFISQALSACVQGSGEPARNPTEVAQPSSESERGLDTQLGRGWRCPVTSWVVKSPAMHLLD